MYLLFLYLCKENFTLRKNIFLIVNDFSNSQFLSIMKNTSDPTLINLAAFRKDNHMSQDDLAKFLHTSRSFVSSIESGRSKLPEERLLYIYQRAKEDNKIIAWSVCPAYSRLHDLDLFLKKAGQCKSLLEDIVSKDGQIIEESMLSSKTLEDIRMGRIGIPPYFIEEVCRKFPKINKRWLATGQEEMVRSHNQENSERNEEISSIQNTLDLILKEMNDLRSQMNRIITKLDLNY